MADHKVRANIAQIRNIGMQHVQRVRAGALDQVAADGHEPTNTPTLVEVNGTMVDISTPEYAAWYAEYYGYYDW
jgi:hypothetical protein